MNSSSGVTSRSAVPAPFAAIILSRVCRIRSVSRPSGFPSPEEHEQSPQLSPGAETDSEDGLSGGEVFENLPRENSLVVGIHRIPFEQQQGIRTLLDPDRIPVRERRFDPDGIPQAMRCD